MSKEILGAICLCLCPWPGRGIGFPVGPAAADYASIGSAWKVGVPLVTVVPNTGSG